MKRWKSVLMALLVPAAAAPQVRRTAPAPPPRVSGQSVLRTKHNLSVTGPGSIRALSETRVCIFCHVAHHGAPHGSNRPESDAAYRLYASSTLASRVPNAPTGASRTCLSCHDGTIALGQTLASGRIAVRGTDPSGKLVGPSNLGTDLRRTHPFSFQPVETKVSRRPDPKDPVRLDRGGSLQCTSCHDPHRDDLDPVQHQFLVRDNRDSALCLACHVFPQWKANPAAHQASTASFGPAQGSTAGYATVAQNACMSCHRSHAAGEGAALVKRPAGKSEDAVCLTCHDGTVARSNVAAQVARPFAHAPPATGPSGHDAAEGPDNAAAPLPERRQDARRHVSCVDCHDPHAAYRRAAAAPLANGTLSGAWGIDRSGQKVDPVNHEYEICFKCHADSANRRDAATPLPPGLPVRAVLQTNLRLVLDPSAASFHPVVAPGGNPDVPSLLDPFRPTSFVYCGDCHGADDSIPGEPRGPHGSTNRFMLVRPYSTADLTVETPAAYALCYKCHSRDVLLSARTPFSWTNPTTALPESLHARHLRNGAPCSACHASHGVAATAGNAINNAHLIDFDVSIVKPNPSGLRRYTDLGPGTGSCALVCHGKLHDDRPYRRP